jgi:outer membrane lipopolysaccharide assembly protein LptE/RlpB
MTALRTAAHVALLAAVTIGASGCGYALAGRGSFLPDYIRIVGVPAFESKEPIFDLDRVMTDAVRREFAGRGRYTVVPDTTNVDAVLTVVITNVRQDNTAFTAGSQASRIALVVTASVEFLDLRENKVLWSNPSMTHREEYDVSTSTTGGDVSAFFGQNTNAMQRLAQNFSREVVTSIMEAF